ncbi:RICIN domain-containing protein [Jidongwangia harbinensis]|uniref:RICIN domain-containing protein n=1 Tax=Jidongwangia harbinensis TaxID=2878561 RepID=UPI001CD9FF06|nr:RICIN domain-containing protein [Jidongwangia harbinensis]MCA2211843.1 hypothetical protein [Jidongwangia harbinensis]
MRRRAEQTEPTPAQRWVQQSYQTDADRAPKPRRAHRFAIAALGGAVLLAGTGVTVVRGWPGRTLTAASGPSGEVVSGPRITSDDPTLCLAAVADRDGATLTLLGCDGSPAQQWRPGPGSSLRIGDRCMEVTGAGQPARLARCSGARSQRFLADGGRLVGEPATCLDVTGPRVAAGAGIVGRACDRTTARNWWRADG